MARAGVHTNSTAVSGHIQAHVYMAAPVSFFYLHVMSTFTYVHAWNIQAHAVVASFFPIHVHEQARTFSIYFIYTLAHTNTSIRVHTEDFELTKIHQTTG